MAVLRATLRSGNFDELDEAAGNSFEFICKDVRVGTGPRDFSNACVREIRVLAGMVARRAELGGSERFKGFACAEAGTSSERS